MFWKHRSQERKNPEEQKARLQAQYDKLKDVCFQLNAVLEDKKDAELIASVINKIELAQGHLLLGEERPQILFIENLLPLLNPLLQKAGQKPLKINEIY